MTTHDVDAVALQATRAALRILEEHAKGLPQYEELRIALLATHGELEAKRSIERRIARAAFPFAKTIESFDFCHQPALWPAAIEHALSPEFVRDGRSLTFTGRSGRGKTHLAIAIAHRAILNDFDALFVSASRLVDWVARESRRGRSRRALMRYVKTKLLVLDDLGFARHNPSAASILFEVVNERYMRKASIIVTANPPPQQWAEVLGDEHAADAIAGRLLERGRHFELGGPSLRVVDGATAAAGECASPPAHAAQAPLASSTPAENAPPVAGDASNPQDVDVMFMQLARVLVGRFGLKESLHNLRRTMSSEALTRASGSRRGAAHLLQVDRRYVQRLAEDWGTELDAP